VTPEYNSIAAYPQAKTQAGIGIGGNSGIIFRVGKYTAKASSTPKTPPDAPTVGAGFAPNHGGRKSCARAAVMTDAK
jgi:hypothetical protein